LFPRIDKVKIFHVKVLGGGIWISSQAAARILLQVFQIQTAPKEFIFLLPYHEMTFAMVEADGSALDEKSPRGYVGQGNLEKKPSAKIPAQAELGRTTLEI